MTTHISYKCAKKLKNFLGSNAPEPMDGYYIKENMWYQPYRTLTKDQTTFPAYQLHDLLSKTFAEAFHLAAWRHGIKGIADISVVLFEAYKDGRGILGVERAIEEMMK